MLVPQVHYASVDHIPESGDDSGVFLEYTSQPQPKGPFTHRTSPFPLSLSHSRNLSVLLSAFGPAQIPPQCGCHM